MEELLSALKALSDETRLRLMHLLLNQDLCVRALARRLDISEAAVSQQLKILRDAGLMTGEKRGYWTHHTVQREALENVIHELERMAHPSEMRAVDCHRVHARKEGHMGKEVKAMCQCCCEKPDKLKGKPEECTPVQIKECHGDEKKHPCEGEKKEGK